MISETHQGPKDAIATMSAGAALPGREEQDAFHDQPAHQGTQASPAGRGHLGAHDLLADVAGGGPCPAGSGGGATAGASAPTGCHAGRCHRPRYPPSYFVLSPALHLPWIPRSTPLCPTACRPPSPAPPRPSPPGQSILSMPPPWAWQRFVGPAAKRRCTPVLAPAAAFASGICSVNLRL